jgi:hypothetical protein
MYAKASPLRKIHASELTMPTITAAMTISVPRMIKISGSVDRCLDLEGRVIRSFL